MRVIVTRPRAQAEPWVERLQGLGVDAVALPLLGIEPAPDRSALEAAWSQLDGTALVMFVSANAVQHFFDARPLHCPWPAALIAGSTGPGTTAALAAAGVPAGQVVEPVAGGPYDTEALWRQIGDRSWADRRVLVVRGQGGRDWLAEQLRQAGAQVDFVTAYYRVPPVFDGPQTQVLQAALAEPAQHLWHFSSSEAATHLARARPDADWADAVALATHARIAEHLRRLGFGRVQPVGVRPEDVLAALPGFGAASIESPPL